MSYLYTYKFRLPLDNYKINRPFLSMAKNRVEGMWVPWGKHLGEDINCPENTPVFTIGRGKVVYSKLHEGRADKPNWGNIIIIAHKNPRSKKVFFSLYGHLKIRLVQKGDTLIEGQQIGNIAPANSKENGWWNKSHLHFAIYRGKWTGSILPGYYKEEQKRTKLTDWVKPSQFIKEYGN